MSSILNRRLDKIEAADEPELGLADRLEAAKRRTEEESRVSVEQRLEEYQTRIAAGEELDETEARIYRACQRLAGENSPASVA